MWSSAFSRGGLTSTLPSLSTISSPPHLCRRRQRMRALFAAAVLMLGSLVSSSAALAQPIELKLGHVGSPGSLFEVSSTEFARRVKEKTSGKVIIQIYGSSQLGDDTELMQKVKLGTIDFALPSTVMSSVVPASALLEMLYLAKAREQMRRINKEMAGPTLVPTAEKGGYKIPPPGEKVSRKTTNTPPPTQGPADLAG